MNKEDFYLNKPEPNKSCLLAMRDILLSFNKNIEETVKYGMPCFLYKGKMFCYLWQDKISKQPYFLMVDGNLIEHPALEKGKRTRMKTLTVDPNKDLPMDVITEVLETAIGLRNK